MTNTNKLHEALKIASIIPGIFFIVLTFFFGGITLGDGYNVFNPYADTEFAKNYSPEKFKSVKEGMKMNEIIKMTGEPLNVSYDTTRALLIHTYTRDGWIRRGHHSTLSLSRDQAWYGSSVEYSKDSIAVKVYAGWYYD